MKNVFLTLAGITALAVVGSAQSLTINNNTPCNYNINAHAGTAQPCPSSGTIVPLNGSGSVTMNPNSSVTLTQLNFLTSSVSGPYYPDNVHFIGIILQPMIGDPCSTWLTSTTVSFTGCPGSYTATWTSLPGGSAQVDIR